MREKVKYIAFDADDTLWVNEPYFREAEARYCALLARFAPPQEIIDTLYQTELKNLAPYGYGAKAFTLSLMETAIGFSNRYSGVHPRNSSGEDSLQSTHPLTPDEMAEVIRIGTSLINVPMEILPGVEQLLKKLHESGKYRLIVATKGDLLDQNRKLQRSGLDKYFHCVEVMYDKNEKTYSELLKKLNCKPREFLMIGNSMKSDILPVLNTGGNGIYIPFHSTWEHEKVEGEVSHPNLYACSTCEDLLDIF
ncbi:MAG: HAD family hydrolase [Bacteroidales bacterium]|nr:HAD family hydrolase [Bacteroidales bacterium]